ncbi:rRNA pseudouridine synthase [Candidatus Microgenomates bacterium]|nr:rRNA pseudouridine synthase [Candidatus Microgenomates bacterium]
MQVRLNKFLASSGVSSRRGAEELMKNSQVSVNGVVVTEMGFQVDTEQDRIFVGGKQVQMEGEKVYYLLNKPVGYITTSLDPFGRKKAVDLVPKNPRVFSVGRLDHDTSGALLFTNDGDLANKLTHPRYEKEKEYLVSGRFKIQDSRFKNIGSIRNEFIKGVELKEGLAKADKVEIVKESGDRVELKIVLHQGWNRQIRRMCEVLGLEVLSLKRIRFGHLSLGDLGKGRYKKLTKKEIDILKK